MKRLLNTMLPVWVVIFMMTSNQLIAQNDFISYEGVIRSQSDNNPIPGCSIGIKGKNLGTAANSNGEFQIKVAQEDLNGSLVFSSIGYLPVEISINNLKTSGNVIEMKQDSYVLDNITVREPKTIILEALSKISSNYPDEAEGLTSFYRETVTKNKKFVDVSQGIISVYKAPYSDSESSLSKILKGYRSVQYKKEDTLAFKLQSGLNTILRLDLVKNPGDVLSRDVLDLYEYKLEDVVDINGQKNYKISFQPVLINDYVKYSGFIFVNQESLAFSAINFGYSDEAVQSLGKDLIKKKPTFAKLTPLDIRYEVAYKESGSGWYLSYVKNVISMKCNWRKKLFNKTFTATSEMVTTKKEETIDKESFERKAGRMIFSDEAPKYDDPTFWEDYSIIKPEDDIKKALKKINRLK